MLWLAKVPPAKLEKLFPPNEYVLPDDIFFEASGILTFAIGVWLAVRMLPPVAERADLGTVPALSR